MTEGSKPRSVRMTFKPLLAVAVSLAMTIAAHDALAASKKKTPRVTVKKHVWKGYGFLPGYPRNERERRRDRDMTDRRFIGWDGRVYYGFGRPGFYGGQYNGGSIGPCWTSTPIGFIYNCGG